jgi:hypothetical protein
MTVTGSGFSPGAPVNIYAVSPGLAHDETTLATVTADVSGAVDSAVTVPDTATGFPAPGLGANLAFINAIGHSDLGGTTNDLEIFGITPLSGLCGTLSSPPSPARPPEVGGLTNLGSLLSQLLSTVIGRLTSPLAA